MTVIAETRGKFEQRKHLKKRPCWGPGWRGGLYYSGREAVQPTLTPVKGPYPAQMSVLGYPRLGRHTSINEKRTGGGGRRLPPGINSRDERLGDVSRAQDHSGNGVGGMSPALAGEIH